MAYFTRPDACLNPRFKHAGDEFQIDFVSHLERQFRNDNMVEVKNCINIKELDDYNGTDAIYRTKTSKGEIISEIRLDPTLGFEEKNNMPYIAESDISVARNVNLWFGIRHGNLQKVKDKYGHTVYDENGQPKTKYNSFEKPVVVVGLNMTRHEYNAYYKNIIFDELEKKMVDIVDFAQDCLDDYENMDLEDRKELYQTPLKKNPNYKPPKKNVNAKYKAIEDWRNEFVYGEKGPDYD